MPFVKLVGSGFFIKASGVEDDLHFHGLVESLASVRQNEQFADLVSSNEIFLVNNNIFVQVQYVTHLLNVVTFQLNLQNYNNAVQIIQCYWRLIIV